MSRRAAAGVSLIEVMVAILVFSIGMLGLALLQIKGAQYTRESSSRSTAVGLARSLAESMRANPDGALPKSGTSAYVYDGSTSYTTTQCNATDLSSPTKIATRDLACWSLSLAKSLPPPPSGGSLATVTQDTSLGTLVITVSWAGVANGGPNAASQSYSFTYLQ